jgi:lysine 2,3-aminomutase
MDALPVTLRTVDQLEEAGFVAATDAVRQAADRYAVAITPAMASVIRATGAQRGVGLQFLPSAEELLSARGESGDPIADKAHEVSPGLVHRYRDRVLLKVHHACPVYCRFCFRREMVGPQGEAMSQADLNAAFAYIAGKPDIFEVILTGGDPFLLPPRKAEAIVQALSAIGHVKVLRWHTRVPVVDPGRVTEAFVRALTSGGKAVFVGVHANHANEFTPEAQEALSRLARSGIALVSQSVLLRGVNDTAEALEDLMRAFVANRVKPYYLHQMDPAPGTAHFVVPAEEGRRLISTLRDRMTGLAIPAYVADGPTGRKRHIDPQES